MNDTRGDRLADIAEALDSVRRRLRSLTVAVIVMTLVLFLTVAAVYGYLAEFHSWEGLLVGASAGGAGLLGFAVGWFARRIA